MTDTSKMRSEFEAWVLSEYPNQSLERFNPLHGVTEGEYMGFTVQHCWKAWQASRQAVVVMPDPAVPGSSCIRTHSIQEVIEATGLRCEVKL